MPERQPHAPPIPLTTLGELGEAWVFDVRCGKCRNKVRLSAAYLASAVGRQTRIGELIGAFRCHKILGSTGSEKCGGRPRSIILAKLRQRGSFAVSVREIPLLDMSPRGYRTAEQSGAAMSNDQVGFDLGDYTGPGLQAQVIRRHPATGQRHLDRLTWGLVPAAMAGSADLPQPIHARAETVVELPMFAPAFASRRAIAPADRYFLRSGAGARYTVTRRDGLPLAMAALWEAYPTSGGGVVRTYCIITVPANTDIRPFRDRMPLVLEQADWPLWLGEASGDPAALLRPSADDVLVVQPVQGRRSAR
jgi:putative SOS response-associated peptidase YedK